MTREKFESMIGYHCSPVLAGLKPSNLVSFSKEKFPELPKYAKECTKLWKKRGICLEIICQCGRHYLMLVYRPEMMEQYLNNENVRTLLKEDGYPEGASLETLLEHLKLRFQEKKEFPHEIGLFLGYPLGDVIGFREHKGGSCKLCGYWKVYGDVEKTRRLFEQFDRCREAICRQIKEGRTISQLLCSI